MTIKMCRCRNNNNEAKIHFSLKKLTEDLFTASEKDFCVYVHFKKSRRIGSMNNVNLDANFLALIHLIK